MSSKADGKGMAMDLQGQRQRQARPTRLSTQTIAGDGLAVGMTHSWSLLFGQLSLPDLRSVLLFAVLLHLFASLSAWSQPASDGDHLKAAFLFHFAQLVEWPGDAFEGNDSPLVVCTLEDDAFYEELENTIQGKQIGSRTIRIRHIHISQATRGCNMLFISKREGKNLSLATLRNLPVLTVGEADDFVSSGGMIGFHLVEDKVRFDISLGAADSSHIKISSRLLMLATSVVRGSGTGQGR